MSRQARQKRPVAEWQREQSVLPMHSAVVLRLLQRGQSSSPHSFFWRQKWQVMPADSKGHTHSCQWYAVHGDRQGPSTAQHAISQTQELRSSRSEACRPRATLRQGPGASPTCHAVIHGATSSCCAAHLLELHLLLLRQALDLSVTCTHACESRGEWSVKAGAWACAAAARSNSIQTVTDPKAARCSAYLPAGP